MRTMNQAKAKAEQEPKSLKRDELLSLVEAQAQEIAELKQLVLEQGATIRALQDQMAKTSQNSHKPPSSDGLKKPNPKNLRQPSGRKPGGQPGHEGHRLELSEVPDQVVRHELMMCPHCARDLSAVAAQRLGRRQVYDVPPVHIEITEHQVECKVCPHCQQEGQAAYPADVTKETQYGSRLKAQASYLNVYQLIPMARSCELLGDFYHHEPAPALIIEANRAVQAGSAPTLDAIKEQLIAAEVTHHDESGLRIAGKTQWLHVASTEELTYYEAHHKRGREAMNEIDILPNRTGTVVHDHWSSYQTFDQCAHAYCNAHHLRELRFIHEEYQQAWAHELSQLLLEIKAAVAVSAADANALPPERIRAFEARYDELLTQGFDQNPVPDQPPTQRGRIKQSPPKNLLDRLHTHKAEVLAFMLDFRIPFDNNLAERDIRMIKLKQKISGAFRTTDGADTFCHIRSYISTVRKHGANVIDAIANALTQQPFVPNPSAAHAE